MMTAIWLIGAWGAYVKLRDEEHNITDALAIGVCGWLMASWAIQGIL